MQPEISHDVFCIDVKQGGDQYTTLMYSSPNLEPVLCFMSSSNCGLLTYIQISQEAGKAVWYSHVLENFPKFVVIHTVKGFNVVSEAEYMLFSGILLLFLLSDRCLEFDLCFPCLF